MKRDKNIKITPQTHKLLKEYCEKNGSKDVCLRGKTHKRKMYNLKKTSMVMRLIKYSCSISGQKYGSISSIL